MLQPNSSYSTGRKIILGLSIIYQLIAAMEYVLDRGRLDFLHVDSLDGSHPAIQPQALSPTIDENPKTKPKKLF